MFSILVWSQLFFSSASTVSRAFLLPGDNLTSGQDKNYKSTTAFSLTFLVRVFKLVFLQGVGSPTVTVWEEESTGITSHIGNLNTVH